MEDDLFSLVSCVSPPPTHTHHESIRITQISETVFWGFFPPFSFAFLYSSFSSIADIDECKVIHDVCRNGECVNERGSYHCTCKEGYTTDITGTLCIGALSASNSVSPVPSCEMQALGALFAKLERMLQSLEKLSIMALGVRLIN